MNQTEGKWIVVPTLKSTQQILVDHTYDPRILDGYMFEVAKNGISIHSHNGKLRIKGQVDGSVNELFGTPKFKKRTNRINTFDYTAAAFDKYGTPRITIKTNKITTTPDTNHPKLNKSNKKPTFLGKLKKYFTK
jgi:hypothetical protein